MIVIVCDNGGFAVIDRLQVNQGGEPFNNLLATPAPPVIWCASTSPPTPRRWAATPRWCRSIAELAAAFERARRRRPHHGHRHRHRPPRLDRRRERGGRSACPRRANGRRSGTLGRPSTKRGPPSGAGSSDGGGAAAHRRARMWPDRPDARRAAEPTASPALRSSASTTSYTRSPRRLAEELGVPALDRAEDVLAAGVDAVAICTSTDTPRRADQLPPPRPAWPSSARSRSRSISLRWTSPWRRSTPPGCCSTSGSTAASIRPTRRCREAVASGRIGAAAPAADHQPGPVATTDRLHRSGPAGCSST